MSATVDSINRELSEKYWSTYTKSGHTVFPLRSGPNGFPAPGAMLFIRENKKRPEETVAQVLSNGFRVKKEQGQVAGKLDSVIRFAHEVLRLHGVPRRDAP